MKPSDIARLCCDFYSKLPKKGKPVLDNGEWTVMSAVVISNNRKSSVEVVALGTGTKCLGASEVATNGTSLNDGHAEVVARRAFVQFMIQQVETAILGAQDSIFCRSPTVPEQFCLKKEITIYFFSTQVPCGDASIMEKDDEPHSKRPRLDIHRTGAKCVPQGLQDPFTSGVDYHVVGPFRTKPGRGEPTLSLSCSDKMAKWNFVGLQGALLSRFLSHPIKWSKIVILNENVNAASASVKRALVGRFEGTDNVDVHIVADVKFEHERCGTSKDPAPGSIIWFKGIKAPEVCVDGYRLGATKKIRGTPKAAVIISPWCIFSKYCELLSRNQLLGEEISPLSYRNEKKAAEVYVNDWKRLKASTFAGWPERGNRLDFTIDFLITS